MSKRKGLTKQELEKFKELLLQKREQLIRHVQNVESSSLSKDHLPDVKLPDDQTELSSEGYEVDFALHRIESVDKEIQLIDEALEKIENRTYGICEECGEPIPKRRLEVLPYAKFCVKCKQELEKELEEENFY